MARLNILWTNTALKQRDHTFQFWNERNESNSYSKKLSKKIQERVNLLKSNPLLGKKSEYKNTRVISLGHYSILYKQIHLNIIIGLTQK